MRRRINKRWIQPIARAVRSSNGYTLQGRGEAERVYVKNDKDGQLPGQCEHTNTARTKKDRRAFLTVGSDIPELFPKRYVLLRMGKSPTFQHNNHKKGENQVMDGN